MREKRLIPCSKIYGAGRPYIQLLAGGALLIVVKYATLTVAVLKEKTVRCAAHQGTLLYIDKI